MEDGEAQWQETARGREGSRALQRGAGHAQEQGQFT